jgi:pimeloyl-ACP methyl ester carboxylesterase
MPRAQTSQGVDLVYDVAGPTDGAPVLLLHGLSSSRDTWHDVAAKLEPTYRVYALDQRGHGESARTPDAYRVEHYAADAGDFVATVIGTPAMLVGHSLGGLVAANLAATQPAQVRGAFLEDPPLYMGDKETFGTTIFSMFFPMARQAMRDVRDRAAPLAEVEAMVAAIPAMTGEGSMVLSRDRRHAVRPTRRRPAHRGPGPPPSRRARPRRCLLRRARGALPQDAPARQCRPRRGRHPRRPRRPLRGLHGRPRGVPRHALIGSPDGDTSGTLTRPTSSARSSIGESI